MKFFKNVLTICYNNIFEAVNSKKESMLNNELCPKEWIRKQIT